MIPEFDPKRIAASNPAVDAKKIEEAAAIRQTMEKAGVFKKANYRLSPPLGNGGHKASPSGTFVVRMTHSA